MLHIWANIAVRLRPGTRVGDTATGPWRSRLFHRREGLMNAGVVPLRIGLSLLKTEVTLIS